MSVGSSHSSNMDTTNLPPSCDHQSSPVSHAASSKFNIVKNSNFSNNEQDPSGDDEGCNSNKITQINEEHDEDKDEIRQETNQDEEEAIICEDSRHEVQQPSEEIHPAISSGHVGKVVKLKAQRPLTDSEKLYVLKNHFMPGKDYQSLAEFLLDDDDSFS